MSTGGFGEAPLTTGAAGFRWYKDGALLTPGGKYRTLSEPRSGLLVLEIREASKEDLGHYECEVSGEDAGKWWGACCGATTLSSSSIMHDVEQTPGSGPAGSMTVHQVHCHACPWMRQKISGPLSPPSMMREETQVYCHLPFMVRDCTTDLPKSILRQETP